MGRREREKLRENFEVSTSGHRFWISPERINPEVMTTCRDFKTRETFYPPEIHQFKRH